MIFLHRFVTRAALIASIFRPAAAVTMEEVETHNSEDDCWSALYGKVYDLTLYGEEHTGGNAKPDQVWSLCGIDGTSKYDNVHGDNRQRLDEFSSIVEVGTLTASASNDSTPQSTQPSISLEELALHDNPEDCWVAYYDSVYDLTVFAYEHPGPGEKVIHMSCGDDGTETYAEVHSRKLLSLVVNDKVGNLEGAGTSNAPIIETAAPIMMIFLSTFIRMWL